MMPLKLLCLKCSPMLSLQLTLARQHCLVSWILLLHLTLLTTPFSLRDYVLTFGVVDSALQWMTYLTGRTQYVRYRGEASTTTHVYCGVPQGSVLRPILFICSRFYRAGLQLIIFWPSCTPGRGTVAGQKNLAPPY